MNRAGKAAASLAVALVMGVGSALLVIQVGSRSLLQQSGPWGYNALIGSDAAGPYLRAFIAWVGLFALKNSETVYYIAYEDSEGNALNDACDYRVEGAPLDARWWSIGLYAEDHFLLPNPQNRYSFSSSHLLKDKASSFSITVSPEPGGSTWLPSKGAGDFSLTIRMYNPAPEIVADPGSAVLPRIIRERCT